MSRKESLDILGGDLNPDKVFYVIRRYPEQGFFQI